jgi:hypothetical protein
MDGDEPDPGHADREPQAFVTRRPQGGAVPGWRRALSWLFRDREDIEQEGLLAERTMRAAPHRARRDVPEQRRDTRAQEPG